MIIVHMTGGLGNQMFQYALFRNLYDKNENVYYETFFTKPHHNGFELDKVFNIITNEFKDQESLRKFEKYGDKWQGFDPEVFNKKTDVYFEGNWQNIGYFPDESILRHDFVFKQELDDKNKELLKQIQETNSVSIHIRRTDYTKYVGYFFQADWFNYYARAVSRVASKTIKPNFFVFSDDIDWCKKNVMLNCTFVENKGNDSWKDLLLMSNCKHNITTNSTFSWWAGWLNTNPEKIVTTPSVWILDPRINTASIAPKEWLKL